MFKDKTVKVFDTENIKSGDLITLGAMEVSGDGGYTDKVSQEVNGIVRYVTEDQLSFYRHDVYITGDKNLNIEDFMDGEYIVLGHAKHLTNLAEVE